MASSSAGECTLAFATLVPINLWVGARYRTTVYSLSMSAGLLLEVMGYVGKILLRNDLASKTYFALSLLGTAMGPTLMTAAIYTILPHILAIYGSDLGSTLEPVWLSSFFFAFDGFTLAFQAIGCVFAAQGYNAVEIQQGVNVLIAGLALQIISLVGFFGLYFWFMSRIFRNREGLDPRFSSVYLSARFKTALLCVQLALALILARTVARVVQLSGGLASAPSQSHIYSLVLDGALVLAAAIIMALFPPGPAFGLRALREPPLLPQKAGTSANDGQFGPAAIRNTSEHPCPGTFRATAGFNFKSTIWKRINRGVGSDGRARKRGVQDRRIRRLRRARRKDEDEKLAEE
ncbi:hypothetical protein Daus18300_006090 [Diaporthe australafricana]|uniref:Sphingoid long-chain base transporter RSB1 n=1 Tax=Diaporthe australafricana TaxID=127596 RepID=A0ABR3WX81_9PEZI